MDMEKTNQNKAIKRFDVWLLNFDPTIGSEVKKTRPAVIVSPNIMNEKLLTVIAAPLTSTIKGYPSRIPSSFGDREGEIMLDQIRAVDKSRLFKRLGNIDEYEAVAVSQVLETMFSY
jgi:mRNA interferase MazF